MADVYARTGMYQTPPVGPLALLTITASIRPIEGMDSGFLYGVPSFRNFEERFSCINS